MELIEYNVEVTCDMDDSIKMLNSFINMAKNNDYGNLVLICIIILSIWLFKEFRKNKADLDDLGNKRIDEALQLYGKAIFSIKQYKLNTSSINKIEPFNDLIPLYPYTTMEIVKLIDKVIVSHEDDDYEKIYNKLSEEITRLKSLQYDSVAFKFKKYSDLLYFYYKKNNFSNLIIPLVSTVITIFCIIYMMIFILSFDSQDTIIGKTIITLNFCGLMFYILVFTSVIEIIGDKKIKNSIINWVSTLIFLLSPLIFSIGIKWLSSILFLYVFIYPIFILKKIIKKEDKEDKND